jgi:ABC-type nitrate/sulfonate/bicarbonate transport system substrate-binding protein
MSDSLLDTDITGAFVKHLGVEFVELSGDKVVATWTAKPELHQPYGIVHGGVHCSVVETLASIGAALWIGDKGKVVGVTGPGGIAEFAAVEGLAKKGLVRDRDYKILYGVGNSPSRAQALESGKIQASPFSFLERLELEKKGFPTLFDIGSAMPGFPFVVIVTSKQKIENDPDEIVGVLRAIQHGLDFLKRNREKVADSIIKKNKFGDPSTVRQVINQFAEVYSISLHKTDIEALIGATRIEADAKKLGGTEKFYTLQFLTKATGPK